MTLLLLLVPQARHIIHVLRDIDHSYSRPTCSRQSLTRLVDYVIELVKSTRRRVHSNRWFCQALSTFTVWFSCRAQLCYRARFSHRRNVCVSVCQCVRHTLTQCVKTRPTDLRVGYVYYDCQDQLLYPMSQVNPLRGLQTRLGCIKRRETAYFPTIKRYNLKMIGL